MVLDGSEHIVVYVDAFTKWAKVGVLKLLDSSVIATWFHKDIIYQCGALFIVRSDRGTEYQRNFS